MKSIAIFGAGIAGLTAAHELVKLGYKVSVYESTPEAGGFFRSGRDKQTTMPTEYSWHGLGPWYNNSFDLMRDIPFDAAGSIFDRALSRPIDFGIFPDNGSGKFYDVGILSVPSMFQMNQLEFVSWLYLMLKTWTSNKRSKLKYSKLNAAQAWKPLLKEKSYKTWRACFGPWVGSDWSNVSLHTTGEFFKKQLTTRIKHKHPADAQGEGWVHKASSGWLLFKGPSSEFWFKPWVEHLTKQGVVFTWNTPLVKLEFNEKVITGAVTHKEVVTADFYIVAINPYILNTILNKTPSLEQEKELKKIRFLTKDKPHTQISFRIAFKNKIKFPRDRTGVVLSDSPFNITIFAQEQAWSSEIYLGKNIQSLWTGTSCISTIPGDLFNKSVEECTKEEFIQEIKNQVLNCKSLDKILKESNQGKGIKEFEILTIEVWDEWEFTGEGVKYAQPKWVNNTSNQEFVPQQKTSLPNLILSGAHTQTEADVWSIEGAVESGRRAGRVIDTRVSLVNQSLQKWTIILGKIDDVLFYFKMPQILDFIILLIFLKLLWELWT